MRAASLSRFFFFHYALSTAIFGWVGTYPTLASGFTIQYAGTQPANARAADDDVTSLPSETQLVISGLKRPMQLLKLSPDGSDWICSGASASPAETCLQSKTMPVVLRNGRLVFSRILVCTVTLSAAF